MHLKSHILNSVLIVKYCFLTLFILTSLLLSCHRMPGRVVVRTMGELEKAITQAQPGAVIVMANGTWQDAEILFEGKGTEQQPIALKAEQEGAVILSGQSNLRIAGEYLHVSGLVFKNGYTPTSEVIAFRKDKTHLANHCRVSHCVIDNYNPPERFESDTWVAIYGKHNTFDYNSLVGKRNRGVTLAVRLNSEKSQQNYHQVKNNYFGPRQNLGANGGETLRIGTSHYSLTNSHTLVEGNYFDRCNGEHEIISNKSGNNTYRDNVFYECRGTLTMRHGQHTLVENNYFFGNRKPNTGGIRVINEYQTVKNNYLYGLTGYRFRGALVVMNGVPNSPLNRYNQVVDAKIENNVLVDCDHIQLCAGSDEERSAIPTGTLMAGNLFMSNTNPRPFTIYDDVSGITFEDNIINQGVELPFDEGFEKVDYAVSENDGGIPAPASTLLDKINFSTIQAPAIKEQSGARYYPREDIEVGFGTGKVIQVTPGTNTLIEAFASSNPGDVLELVGDKNYLLTKDFGIDHPVSIKTPAGPPAIIQSEKTNFFRINNEGSLALENLYIDGSQSPGQPGNSVVTTSKYSMNRNYKLFVKNCQVVDLDVNHSFDFLKIYQHTKADTLWIEGSTFKNVTGAILSLDREVEDLGIYNVEDVIVTNSTFEKVRGPVIHLYRGGTDESTFGPIVRAVDNRFVDCGNGKRNKTGASVKFHGVQNMLVDGCTWQNSAPLVLHLTNGEPIAIARNSEFRQTPGIVSNNDQFTTENITLSK